MRSLNFGLALAGVVLAVACAAPIEQGEEWEEVGSVQQSLQTPVITSIATGSDEGTGTARCREEFDSPYVMSGGFKAPDGVSQVSFFPSQNFSSVDDSVFVRRIPGPDDMDQMVKCSNASTTMRTKSDADGSVTIKCASGEVAVGGGGTCQNDVPLYRLRPYPDSPGSEPTGWVASCKTGSVEAYVLCRDKNDIYDFTDCKVRRSDGTGHKTANCASGETVVAGGGYCSGKTALHKVWANNVTASAACVDENASVHTYAICCDF